MKKSKFIWTASIVIILFLFLFLAYYFINTNNQDQNFNKEISFISTPITLSSSKQINPPPKFSSTDSFILDDFINSLKQDSAQINSLTNNFDL